MNKYLVKLGSEMSGGRYFEAIPPVQFQDKEQLPVVTGKDKNVEKNKYLEKIEKSAGSYSFNKKEGERLTAPQKVLAIGSMGAGVVAGRKLGETVAKRLPGPTAKLLTMGVGTIGGAYGGLALADHAFFPREKQSSFSPELLEKLAATALSKRVNDKTKGSRLNVESESTDAYSKAYSGAQNKALGTSGKTMVDASKSGQAAATRQQGNIPSSTLNASLNSGKVDPLTQPLAQRLADRKQAISLKNGGDSPFKDGKGKADQIHNAKTLRQGGNTGAFDNHPNNFGRANAANIESALKDSKAGHTASLKFNQSGSTSFASTAPEVKAPQSLGARIMSRLKSGAGSAAAHVRSRVSSMARTPMGKIGLGVGAVAAAGIGAKALSGPKQEEQPYYSQGYGL